MDSDIAIIESADILSKVFNVNWQYSHAKLLTIKPRCKSVQDAIVTRLHDNLRG